MNQQYPSVLLEKAVNEFAKLPGIGSKTAMRLVLHLLRQDVQAVESFGQSLITLKRDVKYCSICHNISDTDVCEICSDMQRDHSTICVVENIQDVMAIENTHQYKGVYHVQTLVERVEDGGVREVILALSPTMEGDTTNFYIYRKLENVAARISVIARGVAQNDELQYTDEVTLGRSIVNRVVFTGQM